MVILHGSLQAWMKAASPGNSAYSASVTSALGSVHSARTVFTCAPLRKMGKFTKLL